MNVKDLAIQAVEKLPADATWEDIQDRINFMAAVRTGLRELDEGLSVSHEDVKARSEQWLSK